MAASPNHHTTTISDIGETELIRRFFADQPVAETPHGLGIGDDCAVLEHSGSDRLLVTVDQLVERVHFLRDKSRARDIGYKSVAVNFSDIAAMGGEPTGIFLSIGLPPDIPLAWLEEFRDGLFELCKQYEVPLLGGDTTGSKKDIVINVMVLGKVRPAEIRLRSGARAGDIICVTGTLGDSAAGLRLLTDSHVAALEPMHRSFLIERHVRPRPQLEEGRWLGQESAVHAMMDVSDGLGTDAGRIAEQSGAGMDLDVDLLPSSDAFRAFVGQQESEAADLALYGGEDYCLLCTVEAGKFDDVARRFEKDFGTPLYKVGAVTDRHHEVRYYRNGKQVTYSGSGYDHFNF